MPGRPKLPRPNLAWDDVRLFLALMRSCSLAAAARTLGVDASTASRRLAELEGSLAVTLFARSREGITPTEAAEDLLVAAEEIERGVARFTNTVEGLERDVAGLVRLTCPRDLAEVIVAPLIRTLVDRHPRLRFGLEPGESVLDLTRREADIALRIVRPTSGDLVMTKVMTARWVAATSAELSAKLRPLRAFPDAPWIGWSDRYASLPTERWRTKHVAGVEPVVRTDSLTTQFALARAGVGVVLVPAQSLAHYGLVPLPIGKALRAAAAEWPSNDLYLVTHRALRDVPRVRVVWEALVERFRESERPGGR